jgi:hypothetical protein
LFAFLISPNRATCTAHLTFLDLITLTILMNSTNCKVPHAVFCKPVLFPSLKLRTRRPTPQSEAGHLARFKIITFCRCIISVAFFLIKH